jgi:hypothetical protein
VSIKKEKTDEAEREYAYFTCKGKYENDADGLRRHICKGHVFTVQTNMTYCPVCGEMLEILHVKTPDTKAITLASDKCLNCKNRERSAAVNDFQCVGGESRNKQVRGSVICNNCLCVKCCNEIIDDFNIFRNYGLSKVFPALMKINSYAKWVVRHGNEYDDLTQFTEKLRAGDDVLKAIREDVFNRWVLDAAVKAKKEMDRFPDRNAAKVIIGNLNKPLEQVMNQIT